MIIHPKLQTFTANPYGRDFVVGDVHGCVSALHRQLSALKFDYQHDRLFCTGDLVDRGPESAEALTLLDEPWFFSVIGNHEQLIYEGFCEQREEARELILQHGGEWILNYSEQDEWPDWFRKIESLPLGIELENHHGERVGVIHADYPLASWDTFEQLTTPLATRAIWAREPFRHRLPGRIYDIDWVIYGHNITDHEIRLGNRLYIDSGAFRGYPFIIKNIDDL
ncbi:MAG: metallophosphoesterase [Oceanospirillaceae bacterium]|nr:metallophosphoesterase [Oceanospirillaceae bacterium]MBT13949.1 metallophosphoesterase [Oceanospirillaceae bacterium]|tara:strand:- start:37630 stop:38301 length:672 start_codon:yes stop_codon:yes gene_type:complete